jgi:Holliday junction resolvase RusA-like endonuclease
MIEIRIGLPPVGWAAPLKGRYTFYDKRRADKQCIRYLINEQYQGRVLDGHVVLMFYFHFKVPPSASKAKRAAMLRGEIFPTKTDCTNLQKLYEDCLKGIVIEDDRNACFTSSFKKFSEEDEVIIHILSLKNRSLVDLDLSIDVSPWEDKDG